MLITATALDALRTGFRSEYNVGFEKYAPSWTQIATQINSTTASNTYGWVKDYPRLREWLGDRQVKSLSESSYSIANRSFEMTIGVERTKIEDDELGMYAPMMQGLGYEASAFPDELVFGLLAAGFTTPCADNQYFFDTDHPVGAGVVSNMQGGAGAPWILMDTTRPLKPLIHQVRKAPEFVALDDPRDTNVFMRKEYLYGVDLRSAVGFGFWQQAFGSKATLNKANYEAAYQAMTSLRNDEGRPIAIRPNLLVTGPGNRAAAKALLESMLIDGGNTNPLFKDVEVLIVPWLG